MGDRDAKPTSQLDADEVRSLAEHARKPQLVRTLDADERATREMDPTHFRLMLLAEREQLPIEPQDIVHMQRAEAEAWLEMRPTLASGSQPALARPKPDRSLALRVATGVLAVVLVALAMLVASAT